MGRQGPSVTVSLSCFGCDHVRSKRYRVQGDSGCDVSCAHPAIGPRDIGDTTWDTPEWCPLRESALSDARAGTR